MDNSNLVKGRLTHGIGSEQQTIEMESNGADISDEFLEKEFQENTKDGPIYELLKNIISMQQKTNNVITEFVNKEKLEKQQSQPVTTASNKKSKSNNKNKNNNSNNENNNKRIDDNKNDNDKIIKQAKLDN